MAYFFGYTMAYFLWFGLYGLVSIIWYYLVLFCILLYDLVWPEYGHCMAWSDHTKPYNIPNQTKPNQTKPYNIEHVPDNIPNQTKQNQTKPYNIEHIPDNIYYAI
jgi:hypothetical protein